MIMCTDDDEYPKDKVPRWGCECLMIDLRCFASGSLSFDDHYMNCGRCLATFSSGCPEHGCLLRDYWRSNLSRVCRKSRLPSCSWYCLDPGCLCVHLHSDHPMHCWIPFVVCYDAQCKSHAVMKGINKGISLPCSVVRNDMENCPCLRLTCTCIGYSSHYFHSAVHACRCYDQSCLIHRLQKISLCIQPQDPARGFTLYWLHSVGHCSNFEETGRKNSFTRPEDDSDDEPFVVLTQHD
jgi:hypothetical protein